MKSRSDIMIVRESPAIIRIPQSDCLEKVGRIPAVKQFIRGVHPLLPLFHISLHQIKSKPCQPDCSACLPSIIQSLRLDPISLKIKQSPKFQRNRKRTDGYSPCICSSLTSPERIVCVPLNEIVSHSSVFPPFSFVLAALCHVPSKSSGLVDINL